ncbi:MAG: hypothetical protein K0R43_1919 [Pseudoduganella sp.]|jgi:hypothetical protein|nr:hypothetical protein [Pseudoduganella sp.]
MKRATAPAAPRRQALRLASALLAAAALACLAAAPPAQARQDKAVRKGQFTFALLGHSFRNGKTEDADGPDAEFRRLLAEASQAEPVFIIATGIKAASEACSDSLYLERRTLMDGAARPLVLLPAGSDWTGCRNSNGKSNAIERLNRIRELFFAGGDALGKGKLALSRQSAIRKFRDYAENVHWEHENVLFVTLNVPAPNNHYLTEAGRNSEYEDRMVANRAWLQRAFLTAKRKKLAGMVLVMEGDIGAHVEQGFFARLSQKKDGFTETRRLVRALAEKYTGQLLLVDSRKQEKAPTAIEWNKNIGHLALGSEWAALHVIPGSAALFSLGGD